MVRHGLVTAAVVAGVMLGCQEGPVSIGDPPPAPDFSVDQSDPNYIIFTVTSADGFMINWDFGNGILSQKEVDTVYYPFADTYTVSLAVSNKGGATVTKKEIIIESTDPVICQDTYNTLLTGGCDVDSKTWVVPEMDAALANGPPSPKNADGDGTSSYSDPISFWWSSALVNNIPDPLTLDDEYIFGLKGFTYRNDCKGDFYFNWKWANELFGLNQATYADTTHGYIPNDPSTWTLEKVSAVADTLGGRQGFFLDSASGERFNLVLTLSNDNYLGYCSGVSIYQILEISADSMYLRHELAEPDDENVTGPNRLEWRYLRLVAKK